MPTQTQHSSLVRIEVRNRKGVLDPRAQSAAAKARNLGFPVGEASSARVYLIEGDLSKDDVSTIVNKLLADPVTEEATIGVANPAAQAAIIEVHPLPGVMDPAAQTVTDSILNLTKKRVQVSTGTRYDFTGISAGEGERIAKASLANTVVHQITTGPWKPSELPKGHSYQFKKITVPLLSLNDEGLQKLSKDGHLFLNLEEMKAVQAHFKELGGGGRDPSDIELETIAQTWSEHCVHKTLKATVRYRESDAVTKLRSDEAKKSTSSLHHSVTPSLSPASRPGHTVNADGSITIDNLLKRTVAAATHELIADGVDWTLSVFKDNSGVIAFDDQWAVNIKVETHNRPSAIEPYGGAATGIGGCIRDVIATGLGAKPIASTDVFCVADSRNWIAEAAEKAEKREDFQGSGKDKSQHSSSRFSDSSANSAINLLPPGVLPPKRVLQEVVAGVRDYGNRMGIPTVSGGVFFDDRYVGNPLVFCGCIGLIPRDMVKGAARKGDRIIALGGRTGRDGIHGATFSSGELQSSSATEFAHAVQIGNAIEEKRLLDAVLRARDGGQVRRHSAFDVRHSSQASVGTASTNAESRMPNAAPLYSGLTDCGAGGFSSAIGEMAGEIGARVTLENAPVKYAGLSYTEIWISEAQERIVLAVPPANVAALQTICDEEGVELADLGEFGATDGKGNEALVLTYQGNEVGRLSMKFLHDGLPNPTREAVWSSGTNAEPRMPNAASPDRITNQGSRITCLHNALLAILSHPTVASKHWIIRQYDHEVQGNTVVKPLVGPQTRGPGDAAIIEPVAGTGRGLSISQGLQSSIGDPALGGDAYWMTLASIDECVRNLVCVGADPTKIAILDNFCWASCEKPENLGALVRAAWGCYDGAKAYRTPFVSGKDSLSNQLRYVDSATGEQRLIEIPPTLLITGMGIVPDIAKCVTMDAKMAGRALILVSGQGENDAGLGGSLHAQLFGLPEVGDDASRADDGQSVRAMPCVSLVGGPNAAKAVHELIARGFVHSAHDCSEGGVLTAIAEMLIAGSTREHPIGAELGLQGAGSDNAELFGEAPSRYVLEVNGDDATLDAIGKIVSKFEGVDWSALGGLDGSGELSLLTSGGRREAWNVEVLAKAWLGTLDW